MTEPARPTTPDGQWGPVIAGGGRRRWGRVGLIVGGVLLLALVATGAGAALYANAQISRTEVDGLTSGSGPLHVLVVGSDSREGLTPEQQVELTAGGDVGERTDTIFVLSIEGGRAAILAFPRDLLVTRCDGSTGRINAAIGIGGPTCMIQTVSRLSGLPIEHYVAVDFLGFVGIVDAVGGVEVCIDKRIQDPFSGADFQPGCQVLNGRQALAFVRVRKVDNDLERIKRQQQFLRALAGEVASVSTIVNPVALYRTGGRVGSALTADDSLGVLDLLRLAWGGRGVARGRLVTHTVPAVPRTVNGAAVLEPIATAAEALFATFRDGSVLLAADGEVSRDDIQVQVLNASRAAGLAGATRDALQQAGYDVVSIGDAPEQERTVIRYPAGQRAAAELLATDLPVTADLVEDASAATLVLVLGRDIAEAGAGSG
ncbi:MAG TPA: LCP family protein [Nitriliruptorales bacterium]